MTPEQKIKISELIERIFGTIEGEDTDDVATALAFCLFGTVKVKQNLSHRQAVEFCVKHFKTYTQVVFS
jgi:hypothetical protein